MIRALGLCAVLALGACTETQAAADAVARRSAKSAVQEILVTQFPQVSASRVTPYTDCIIDNASAAEILTLAGDSVTGVDQGTADLVLEIGTRPDTLTCLAGIGLPALLL